VLEVHSLVLPEPWFSSMIAGFAPKLRSERDIVGFRLLNINKLMPKPTFEAKP
jgi:hypothetical protein